MTGSMNCDNGRSRIVRAVVMSAVVLESLAATLAPLRAAIPQTGCYKRQGLAPKVEAVIDEFRASVPEVMDRDDIPGAALALVDDQGLLWTEGFGYAAGKKKPVTPDTPFLVCGMSKLITATAVMLAVQDGLVSLDEPITTYLPDFKVNSRYEEQPGQKVTLRRLLNYTAGLPVETPLGNYFEPSSTVSFEDHAKSLYGSWLVCPVGSSFFQSGASSDLAAYAIQVVSHKPFEQYLKDKLFTPLGMSNSTANRAEILKNPQRAVGNMTAMAKLPAVYPALGAGGVYSTARDMARFVQLHIDRGTIDGRNILDRSLMDTIHTPVGIMKTDPNVYYGQGVCLDRRSPERTERVLWHEGWGFGFVSFMHWYPEYGIGVVILANKLPCPGVVDLSLSLTDKLIRGKIVEKRFPQPEPDCSRCIGTWWGPATMRKEIAALRSQ